jgi:CO dehydrogenase maturation factor
VLLIVTEPYYRSLEAASRIRDLALQLNLPHILTVANRVRTPQDESAIQQYCHNHDLNLIATIPFDETIMTAELEGRAVLDIAPYSPAVQAVGELIHTLHGRVR